MAPAVRLLDWSLALDGMQSEKQCLFTLGGWWSEWIFPPSLSSTGGKKRFVRERDNGLLTIWWINLDLEKKCLSAHTRNVLFTFDKVKRDPLSDVLKRFWDSCGHFAMKAPRSGAGHRAGDNNKNKLGGKKQQQWSKVFGKGVFFFIDLMVETIKFYIGQRGF